MRVWILAGLFALTALSGCFGGDDGDDDPDVTPTPTEDPDGPAPPEPVHFEFGPSAGCIGDILQTGGLNCASFLQGPGSEPIDGFWIELDERYWGLAFTTTIDSVLGDSDCLFVQSDGSTVIGDANQGAAPCAGSVPNNTGYIFLYAYAEAATSMTLTFQV